MGKQVGNGSILKRYQCTRRVGTSPLGVLGIGRGRQHAVLDNFGKQSRDYFVHFVGRFVQLGLVTGYSCIVKNKECQDTQKHQADGTRRNDGCRRIAFRQERTVVSVQRESNLQGKYK